MPAALVLTLACLCCHRQCLIFEFSAETGKIVKVRAYLDTEVMAEAKRANGVPVEDA